MHQPEGRIAAVRIHHHYYCSQHYNLRCRRGRSWAWSGVERDACGVWYSSCELVLVLHLRAECGTGYVQENEQQEDSHQDEDSGQDPATPSVECAAAVLVSWVTVIWLLALDLWDC